MFSPWKQALIRFVYCIVKPWLNVKGQIAIPTGPVIFVSNHNCSYETLLLASFIMYHAKGRKVHFLSDWMYGRLPALGWLMNQFGTIYTYGKRARWKWLDGQRPVSPANPMQSCLYMLRQGHAVALFPEGTRNRDPLRLRRGRRGAGYLALHSSAPVFPVGIDFPDRYKKNRIPRWGRLILRCGYPLIFNEMGHMRNLLYADARFHAIRKRADLYLESLITYRIMQALSGLSGKTYLFPEPALPEELRFLSKTFNF